MKRRILLAFLAFFASKIAFSQPCTDPTLLKLPAAAVCEGECVEFDGWQHCSDTTVLKFDLANCRWISQQIIVHPNKVEYVGVVARVKCSQPCVEYLGETFCQPGFYSKKVGCTVRKFQIGVGKDTVDLGTVGKLTCAKPKIEVLNKSYADGGWYFKEDNCTFWQFMIDEDFAKPYISGKAEVCQNATSYTASFHILEATAPFEVAGQPVAGSFFSASVPSGQLYQFVVRSGGSGCKTVASGFKECTFFGDPNSGKPTVFPGETAVETVADPQPMSSQIDQKAEARDRPGSLAGMTAKGQIENFYAPNALKINGLSPNDRFTIFSATDGVRLIRRLDIFAADGKSVFQKANFLPNDPALGWDGLSAKMRPADSPTAFEWVAELELFDGQKRITRGRVTVIP